MAARNQGTPKVKQQEIDLDTLPTEDWINLLVTQAERAFDLYESTLKLMGDTHMGTSATRATVSRAREVLTDAREVISYIKQDPQDFNSPQGFLLFADLQNASRGMAACAAQAGLESKLDLAQACTDRAILLSKVGDTAFNMYVQYLVSCN
jgi:hypothetical protein